MVPVVFTIQPIYMRLILFFLFLFFTSCIITEAQVKPTGNQQAEMQQAIDEIKKEIRKLEDEIKRTTDPEEAASLKKELASLKSMLSMFEKTSKPLSQSPAPVKNQPVKNTPSPITPVVLKQPYTIPTAAQATDRLLWYKGKKINDSTLVTVKGMVVQYNKNNKKRSLVKIQPLKKTDPFDSMVVEFTNGEKRKEALINQFDKLKNGFLFYPELRTALAIYDDLTERMSSVLKNTIELPEMTLPATAQPEPLPMPVAKGPALDEQLPDTIPGKNKDEWTAMKEALDRQMALAEQLYQQLPPVHSFPAPPLHEPGMCSNCDPAIIKKQRLQDSLWLEQYQGKEQRINQMVLGAERQMALLGMEGGDMILFDKLMKRAVAKATILFERYGDEFRCSKVVMQVVLGLERQIQLLGMSDSISFNGSLFLLKKLGMYEQYLEEQIKAKNHDFVLNLASHLGYLRQKALLGTNEHPETAADDIIQQWLQYNRFELMIESDFIVEKRDEEGELQFKATGALAPKEKTYGMLISYNCKYKMIPYTVDYTNAALKDVSINMHVRSGTKTIKDENGKLVNVPYSGPDSYFLTFPDCIIDFCNQQQTDSAWMHTFTGKEGLPVQADHLAYTTSKTYQIDFLIMANLVFVTNDLPQNEQNFENVSQDLFTTMGGFEGSGVGGSKLDKLKTQYQGKMKMDEHRKSIQNLVNDQQSILTFRANNKQTVVTDLFTDTKRKLEEEGLDLTRGLIHFKIVHAPAQ